VQGTASGPAFTGLVVHHDPDFHFVLLVPDGWARLDLRDSSSGVFYAPDPKDLLTGLAIEAQDLGTPVQPADLPTLKGGLLAGVRGLSGSRIEQQEAEVVGDLLTLEARFTFYDGAAARKRWMRLLYQDRTQVRLIAQGASAHLFDYWEPMFFEAMRTVHFGDAI
jgi:hypothetical protein